MKRHEKQPSADVRPRFGSQDFYLSMMLDVPVPSIPVLRARLDSIRSGGAS